ncbi:MAG TPA: hypothetical protein VGB08_10945 [Allosphingosinicella sp.]
MNVDEEIAELRRAAGARSDAELASLLFIQRSAVAQWRKRGSVPERARRSVEKLRAAAAAAKTVRGELDAISPGVRQLARALAIFYSAPRGWEFDEESDVTALARQLKVASGFFEEAERAAALLLEETMLRRGLDLEAAYGHLLAAPWFQREMMDAIMAPSSHRRRFAQG